MLLHDTTIVHGILGTINKKAVGQCLTLFAGLLTSLIIPLLRTPPRQWRKQRRANPARRKSVAPCERSNSSSCRDYQSHRRVCDCDVYNSTLRRWPLWPGSWGVPHTAHGARTPWKEPLRPSQGSPKEMLCNRPVLSSDVGARQDQPSASWRASFDCCWCRKGGSSATLIAKRHSNTTASSDATRGLCM